MNPDDIWIKKLEIYDIGTKNKAIFELDEPQTLVEKRIVASNSTRLKCQLELKEITGRKVIISYRESDQKRHATQYTKGLLEGTIPNVMELTRCIPNSPITVKICIIKYGELKKEKTDCILPIPQFSEEEE